MYETKSPYVAYTQAGAIGLMGLIGLATLYPPVLPITAGAGIAGLAGYHLFGDKIKEIFKKSNATKINEVLRALNYGGAKNDNLIAIDIYSFDCSVFFVNHNYGYFSVFNSLLLAD